MIVKHPVAYSFGFDLEPDSFYLSANPTGIQVQINRPILVASPAVTPIKFDIPSIGVFTDEKTAVIGVQQRLPAIGLKNGLAMAQEEPLRAVCEKKLIEFLWDFLGKQPGVKRVPAITVVYK